MSRRARGTPRERWSRRLTWGNGLDARVWCGPEMAPASHIWLAGLLLSCILVRPREGRVSAAASPDCLSPYEYPSGYAIPPKEVTIAELCNPRCRSFYDVLRSLVETQPECSSMELGGMVMSALCSDCGKPLWPVVQSGGAPDLGESLRGAICASQHCTASFQTLLAHLGTCSSFSAPLPASLSQLSALCAAPEPASRARFAELALHLPDAWFGRNYGRARIEPTRMRPRASSASCPTDATPAAFSVCVVWCEGVHPPVPVSHIFVDDLPAAPLWGGESLHCM